MIKKLTGFFAFLIVLFLMPLGHAAMIVMEHVLDSRQLFIGAFAIGLSGIAMTVWGMYVKKETGATFLGLIGSIFVWTGWIEFGYVYFAGRYHISPLTENGEVVTKPEYLLMPSAVGIWSIIMMLYLFGKRSNCGFFTAIQRFLRISKRLDSTKKSSPSIVTFMEMNVLLLTSYLVLLFAYDSAFLGDRHPATCFIAFASLAWSGCLFLRLLRIRNIAYAIRYAIPVVIIFWTFVEILGRWNLFREIWVHPFDYKVEIGIMLFVLIGLAGMMLIWKPKKLP